MGLPNSSSPESDSDQTAYMRFIAGAGPDAIQRAREGLKAPDGFNPNAALGPKAIQHLLQVYREHSFGYYVLRKFILDMAWAHCAIAMSMRPDMGNEEISNRVLYYGGHYQALYALYQQLDPEALLRDLRNAYQQGQLEVTPAENES